MYASSSSNHVVNLLNVAERNGIISSWKLLGDRILLCGPEGTFRIRPKALDRFIEMLRTERTRIAEMPLQHHPQHETQHDAVLEASGPVRNVTRDARGPHAQRFRRASQLSISLSNQDCTAPATATTP